MHNTGPLNVFFHFATTQKLPHQTSTQTKKARMQHLESRINIWFRDQLTFDNGLINKKIYIYIII